MISYIFKTAFDDVGVFLDATNRYQLTFGLNLFYSKGTISSFIFKFFRSNSLYSKIRQRIKINWTKKKNEGSKINEK